MIDYKTCEDYPDRCHKSGECWERCTLNPNVKPLGFELHGNQLRLDGRRIGWITRTMDKKRVYVSPRNRSGIRKDGKGHYFEIFRGFGIARNVLDFLKLNNFDEIHLRIGLRETLISTPDQWEQHGIPYKHSNWEPQIILPEQFMRRIFLTLADITL